MGYGHRELLCCYKGCAHIICLTPQQEDRYKRTHEDFCCPAGHVQVFYGPTEQEKTIKSLREKLSERDRRLAARDYTISLQESEIRSLRSKLAWRERWLRLRKAVS
jgi:hypothetical protein